MSEEQEERVPRWEPEETWETALAVAQLLEGVWGEVKDRLETITPTLLQEAGIALQKQIAQVAAGQAGIPTPEEMKQAMQMGPRWVAAIREAIKRRFRRKRDITSAFGVGSIYKKEQESQLLAAISQTLAAIETHTQEATIIKVQEKDLQQARHYEDVLQRWVTTHPNQDQRTPDPDIKKRNQIQIEIEDRVDEVIATVAVACWREPDRLKAFKGALPSRSPRHSKKESKTDKDKETPAETPDPQEPTPEQPVKPPASTTPGSPTSTSG